MQEAEHTMFQIITVAAFFVALAAPVNAQTFPDWPVRVLVLTRPGVSPTLRRDLSAPNSVSIGATRSSWKTGQGRQSGGELGAACVVYGAHVGEVAVRTDKH